MTTTIRGIFFRPSLVLQMVISDYMSLTKPYIWLDNGTQSSQLISTVEVTEIKRLLRNSH